MQGAQQLLGSGHPRATWLRACASRQLSARVRSQLVSLDASAASFESHAHIA